MIFQLIEDLIFPDPALAEEDGLLAVGGDLSVPRLLLAYENGIFPWFTEEEPIMWYSPPQRFVLYPTEVKISKSMRQVLNSERFTLTYNQAFSDVIAECAMAKRKGQNGTWINLDMISAYNELHRQGFAHSIEIWENEELVGGLYGVLLGDVFCGESMFSKKSNASKTALIWLCQNVQLSLIDCQVYTEHLESMGARLISRQAFLDHLRNNH
ncbi:leucyl/phenylalanyl-tRNA--protein transferase [Pelobium manganitolerans]|uniref:Leucyl/phenylalanyl-tRNA--protein transferase n=1 Tax=Pelobium manganitolerans TaxID=1842495 RepID=A0A419S7J3_9SPHI|nr:leucyl/phenylalanyl-tRNA--protein transferase [Pelobium manganitolerans]RKD17308.1 leucyl/phenylalanyl-tRNA--protein transferase [Pelobium manganitolerans]